MSRENCPGKHGKNKAYSGMGLIEIYITFKINYEKKNSLYYFLN
jgi:hypothetical protein